MSDLVERLRDMKERTYPDDLMDEAADEIERLTALTEADKKEIGSYTERTGLRGSWKEDGERIAELEAEVLAYRSYLSKSEDTVDGLKADNGRLRAVIALNCDPSQAEDEDAKIIMQCYREWDREQSNE